MMRSSKSPRLKKVIQDAIRPRAIGDGDPEVYNPDELKVLVRYGSQYLRGVSRGRLITAAQEQAEIFRRRFEVIRIFRRLPDRLRKRPYSQATKKAVLDQLEQLKITCSERTLMRDFRDLGGAKKLRDVKPFARGEDASSPFLALP
jgi:hypothetical protein